ncbi:MAG TPA: aminotransferase class IV, partial [Dongiaceae bacterium]|nr:aminotransferase class IV [Dongiaceae bacterium]
FETVRVVDGRPFQWQRHLERLVLSAAELGFPVPAGPDELAGALDQVLTAEGLRDAVARITVTRGIPGARPTRSTAWVEAEPLAGRLWEGTRRGAATLVRSRVPFAAPGWIGRHKTTSRIAWHLARENARASGADEALLVTPDELVLEGAVSNLFVVRDRLLATPPVELGVLPGITRAWVLRVAGSLGIPTAERPIAFAELAEAEEILLTNSIQGIVSVGRLDGVAIAGREIGQRLRARREEAIVAGEP